jgi:RNA polymerase sigma factor for flagellar operon FliA
MRVSLDEGVHSPETAEPPTAEFERAGMRHKVDEALATLPPKERDLIQKHYAEGKTLVEAGEEMGLSKSWASRLHAQAVERLRRRLVRDGP